jgi:hypothetical protein
MTTRCKCGHAQSQHHRRKPFGPYLCDYTGHACECTGYSREVDAAAKKIADEALKPLRNAVKKAKKSPLPLSANYDKLKHRLECLVSLGRQIQAEVGGDRDYRIAAEMAAEKAVKKLLRDLGVKAK